MNDAVRRVNLPPWFDPDRHTGQLESKLTQATGQRGWKVVAIDLGNREATLVRRSAVTTTHANADSIQVELAADTKPSDGDKVAARMGELHPGYTLAKFEPLRGRATLTKMSPQTVRARQALATALSVKPWQVQISPARGGGYDFVAPPSYVPSKHDHRLAEAAQTAIGQNGWWVQVDGASLKGKVGPGTRPSFPAVIELPPPTTRGGIDWQMRLPIGRTMAHGPVAEQDLFLDLSDSAGVLIVGTPGSGKTVTINNIVTAALERGWQIGIGDVPHKATDFAWCKNYVHEGWFGANSKPGTVAVTNMVYGVRDQRRALLDQYMVAKWNDLPDDVRPAPILLVLDELTGLFHMDKLPTGIPKDSPLYVEALEENLMTQQLKSTVRKIALELRFVGVRLLLATQQAQGNTGIDVPLKMALPNRILLGAKPDKTARGHAFQAPDDAPMVPLEISSDEKMSKGVGVAEIEGSASVVFKSYYASIKDLKTRLEQGAVPSTGRPEPSAREIARYTPSLDGGDDPAPPSRLDEGGFGDTGLGKEPVLHGAAKAAHMLKRDNNVGGAR